MKGNSYLISTQKNRFLKISLIVFYLFILLPAGVYFLMHPTIFRELSWVYGEFIGYLSGLFLVCLSFCLLFISIESTSSYIALYQDHIEGVSICNKKWHFFGYRYYKKFKLDYHQVLNVITLDKHHILIIANDTSYRCFCNKKGAEIQKEINTRRKQPNELLSPIS